MRWSRYRSGSTPGITTCVSSFSFFVPSVIAASNSPYSSLRVVFAMISTCWNSVPITMIATFGAS